MQMITKGQFNGDTTVGITWQQVITQGLLQPGTISHHTTLIYQDKMYLFGGSKGNCDPNERLFTLDLKSYKWETVVD